MDQAVWQGTSSGSMTRGWDVGGEWIQKLRKRHHYLHLPLLGIILSGFVASVIAEALDNDVQVEPDSELTYYLKVKYDGVDKEGVQSNDATMAKINSGRIKVTDKIPDGLTFKSFVTSDNGSIGAVSRADSTVSCSGRVIDDTQEALNDTGVWNTDNSEYTAVSQILCKHQIMV